jgi:hypothetical protein
MTTLLKIKKFRDKLETLLGTNLSTVCFRDAKYSFILNSLLPLKNFTLHIYLVKLKNSTSFKFKICVGEHKLSFSSFGHKITFYKLRNALPVRTKAQLYSPTPTT